MERQNIKELKQFFTFIHHILVSGVWVNKTHLNVRGIYFEFFGKIIKGGVKKRGIFYKFGEVSNTSKQLRLAYKKLHLRTISGIVGCNFRIYY